MRVRRALDEEALALLRRDGYLVIDNFMGREEAMGYRDEIEYLFQNGLMTSNCTATMKREEGANEINKVIIKPNVFEVELIRSGIRSKVPRLRNLYENGCRVFERCLKASFPELGLSEAAGGTSMKLQYNAGSGGCFPMHFDGPGGKKDSRRITALLYLNPKWSKDDGGALRVYPFLKQYVDVEPVFDRLLLFFSDKTLHRVLPSQSQRVCFTLWFHGDSIDPPPVEASGAEGWFAALQQPATQRYISKALYDKEFVQSIKDAHGPYAKPLLDIHREDVERIQQTPGLGAVVSYLKNFLAENQLLPPDETATSSTASTAQEQDQDHDSSFSGSVNGPKGAIASRGTGQESKQA